MRLLWFAVCLSTVVLVRSDFELKWNVTRNSNILEDAIRFPVSFLNHFTNNMFNFTKPNPLTENPIKKTGIDVVSFQHVPWGLPQTVFKLHQAINARQPDEDTIINILSNSSHESLRELYSEYFRFYGSNLERSLKNVLTGELEVAVMSWIKPRYVYYAQEIHSFINGMSNERAIIDIICMFNDSIIQDIDTVYYTLYRQLIKEELRITLPSSLRRLLHLPGEYQSLYEFNANADILDIVEDEQSLLSSFVDHPSDIFRFTVNYYRRSGKYLENTIKEKYSGDLQRTLLSIIYHAKGEKNFFSRRLHETLEGDSIDHYSLIRLAIMDKEVTYNEIRHKYQQQYNKNLDEVMTKKIGSGNFRKFIQALFEREPNSPSVYKPIFFQ